MHQNLKIDLLGVCGNTGPKVFERMNNMDSCCDSCKNKSTCKIYNLGLEWGCAKHELIKKKMSFENQLERLYNDPKALDERQLKELAEDGIVIMDALKNGWL